MSPGQHQHYIDSECVSCGACVQACPTDALMEKTLLERGRADRAIITTCGYCGVGCSFKAEVRGDRSCADGAEQGRPAQSWPFMRQGPLRLGLRDASGSRAPPMIRKRIQDPWQEVSWDEAIGYAAARTETRASKVRPRRDRRNHLVALHQRRGLPRAEDGAGGFRQQQCRYLRPRMPFAYRLWPQNRFRHASRNPGLRLRDASRRDHGDRCESNRGPSSVRVDYEAAAAPGRAS